MQTTLNLEAAKARDAMNKALKAKALGLITLPEDLMRLGHDEQGAIAQAKLAEIAWRQDDAAQAFCHRFGLAVRSSSSDQLSDRPQRRVLFAVEDMTRGGAQRVTRDMVAALADAGWECKLAVEKSSRMRNWLRETKADEVLRFQRREDLVHAADDIDALLINLSDVAYQAIAQIAYHRPCMQRIALVHDENSLTRAFLDAVPYLHKIIAVSQRLSQRLREMGVPEEKVFCRRWGVDVDRYRPDREARQRERERLGVADHEQLMVWVARLAEGKRPDLAIETLRYLPESVKLAVVGEGGELLNLQRQVLGHGLERRAFILGSVSDERLPGLYNAADVSLMTSEMEACPLVLQESMACGTPVVAPNIGAIAELVSADCGELVGTAEPSTYAQALERVLQAGQTPDCGCRKQSEQPSNECASCCGGCRGCFTSRIGQACRARIVKDFNLRDVRRAASAIFETPASPLAGVVTATSPEQYPHVKMMIESLRRTNVDLPILVVAHLLDEFQCDQLRTMGASVIHRNELRDLPMDVMRRYPDPELCMWLKPWCLTSSPFDRTIWLDADVIVLRSLQPLLKAADESIVFTPDDHATRHPAWYGPEINSGVLVMDRRREAELLNAWQTVVREVAALPRRPQGMVHHDQAALRLVISRDQYEYQIISGWNEPPNGLIDRAIRRRHRYSKEGWLAEIQADHPNAGVVHWANRPKLPELLTR